MCLARSTPHTGSSGAQGLWSVTHSQTTASRAQREHGPARPLRGQWACLPAGAAAAGFNLGRVWTSRFAKANKANQQFGVGTDYGDDDSATSCERDTSPVRHRALHPLQRVRPEA